MPESRILPGIRILFVCSGNVCRSPMAVRIAESKLEKLPMRVEWLESAGTLGFEGQNASKSSIAVMKELGLDLGWHRSKGLTSELLDESDYIVVMAPEHVREILVRRPRLASKIVKLWEFTSRPKRLNEITDPIGRSYQVYLDCRNDIVECIENWIDTLEAPSERRQN